MLLLYDDFGLAKCRSQSWYLLAADIILMTHFELPSSYSRLAALAKTSKTSRCILLTHSGVSSFLTLTIWVFIC